MEKEGILDKKLLLSARSQEELEEILHRKRSLSLNLKRALPASPGARSTNSSGDASDEMLSSSDQLRSVPENGTDNDENHNRKRKIAAALNLMYPEFVSSMETISETFHTAAAESPDKRLQFPEVIKEVQEEKKESSVESEDSKSDNDLDFKTSVDEIRVFQKSVPELKENGTACKPTNKVEVCIILFI